jgi:hypothetical protein
MYYAWLAQGQHTRATHREVEQPKHEGHGVNVDVQGLRVEQYHDHRQIALPSIAVSSAAG